jgi:hypothetical protein
MQGVSPGVNKNIHFKEIGLESFPQVDSYLITTTIYIYNIIIRRKP